ncbi:MAG: hypothetical protein BGO09_00610 [Bacteroidetes bacterium 47-18]|nr:MAG: hypothetical protein BGO09_00610 [Bacteroidetes bacterium 47-18]
MKLYEDLIDKLDLFIRKYYFNQLLKGALLFLIIGLILFLVTAMGEYYLYFPVAVKLPLVILLAAAGVWGLVRYVITPLFRMQKIGKRITHEQAAVIIGQHFKEVDDKILNVIQLRGQAAVTAADMSLLEAGIGQKTAQLAHVPFTNAVDLRRNRKYLPWFAGLVMILAVVGWWMPQLLKDSTSRLLQPATAFEPPAPFTFRVDAPALRATLWQPHDIVVRLEGDKLPEAVYIHIDGEALLMTPLGDHTFRYTIARVNNTHSFYFSTVGYQSESYRLVVDFLPVIDAVEVVLRYPRHTGKATETLMVFSDLQVPEGTIITWKIQAQHTHNITVLMDSVQVLQTEQKGGAWSWEKQVLDQAAFRVLIQGEQARLTDTFAYTISVIKDNLPVLEVQTRRDTVIGDQMVFTGLASDDYGLQSLTFHYEVIDASGKVVTQKSARLPVGSPLTAQISHYFDAGVIDRLPDQNIRMYIQACDNDIVNGGKCVRSAYVYLKEKGAAGAREEQNALEQNAERLQETLDASRKQQQSMQKDMQDLKNKMLDARTMDWQQEQQLEAMVREQEQLKKQMEAVRKRLEEQQKQTAQMEMSPSLMEKQEEVKKQLNQIIDKELQEQLQRLQELRQQKDPQQAFEKMQQMEQQNKLFQMNMERVQELIKQLELQLAMELAAQKIDEFVAKEQDILEKTERGDLSGELKKEQEQVRKDFEKMVQEVTKDLNAKEQQAKKESAAGAEMKEDAADVSEHMEESGESLDKKDQEGARRQQQQSISKMQQMSKKMKEKAGGMDMEQLDLDIKATRQLLSNLLRFSFDQEKLIEKVKVTPVHSNSFVDLNKEQARLAANARMIRDSLFSLSKRVFQIAATVNKETTELELNIQQSLKFLQDRQTSLAQVRQQHAMTNANSLALILNELLENLMGEMQSSGEQSGGSGGSPGGKSKGKSGEGGEGAGDQLKDIITKQQQLGKGMQQGQGRQGQGGQTGQGTQGSGGSGNNGQGSSGGGGNNGPDGEYGDAKELARMAREQAQLRQQLNQLNSILNSKGIKGVGKQMTDLQHLMDKNETDLVNRRLTRELLLRQQEIMTRLLEAEKAVREQEQDDKRKGNTAKETERPVPPDLKDYMKQQQVLFEQYKTQAPVLKPYYKKVNDNYLQKVK